MNKFEWKKAFLDEVISKKKKFEISKISYSSAEEALKSISPSLFSNSKHKK